MDCRSNEELAEQTEKLLGFRIFSFEYKILIVLQATPQMAVGDLECRIGAATSTLHSKLRNLTYSGHIVWDCSNSDMRRHEYMLSDKIRAIMEGELKFLEHWQPMVSDTGPISAFLTFVRNLERKLMIRVFSPSYLLILGLYDNGDMPTTKLHRWSGLSTRSFYHTLNRLIANGLVIKLQDDEDRRRKYNQLNCSVRCDLDQIHRDLRKWSRQLPRSHPEDGSNLPQ